MSSSVLGNFNFLLQDVGEEHADVVLLFCTVNLSMLPVRKGDGPKGEMHWSVEDPFTFHGAAVCFL